MEKRYQYIVIIIAVILIAGVVLTGLFARVPVVSVSGAGISSVNLSSIGLDITLTVDSPYPVAIPVKSLEYSVAYHGNGSPILLGEGTQKGLILKPGSQKIVIPMLISNPALVGSLWEVLKSGEINLVVNGNVTPEFFGIAPAVPFSKEIRSQVTDSTILSGIKSLAGAVFGK